MEKETQPNLTCPDIQGRDILPLERLKRIGLRAIFLMPLDAPEFMSEHYKKQGE